MQSNVSGILHLVLFYITYKCVHTKHHATVKHKKTIVLWEYMFDLQRWHCPWTDLCQSRTLHIASSWWTILQSFKIIRAVQQYLTDLELILWPWSWTGLSQTCALRTASSWWTFVLSYLTILPAAQEIHSRHIIMTDIQEGEKQYVFSCIAWVDT